MDRTRPHLRQPRYGDLTQGTVFSCASTLRYEGCHVFGLTITARCDVAQNKYPVLNYLPVVALHDWLSRDGLDILISQEQNDQAGNLRGMLKQANVSESLLLSLSLQKIAATHFPTDTGTSAQKKNAEKFATHIKLMDDFNEVLKAQNQDVTYGWFKKNRPKSIEQLIHRLSRHDVLGHYLLERLSLDDQLRQGYVCLLREVQTLPKSISDRLGKGIDCTTYSNLCHNGSPMAFQLVISVDDLAMPIIEVASPTMEHILQAFSQLFGRIGVADPVPAAISGLISTCLAESEGVRG
ncbi:MAG: hypothetical protein U1E48_02690 [Paracoccaceae bacterium]